MAHKAYMSGDGGGLLVGISTAALLVFGIFFISFNLT